MAAQQTNVPVPTKVMPPKKDIHESAEIVLVATAGGM